MQHKNHDISERVYEAAFIRVREAAVAKAREAEFARDVRKLYSILNDDERAAALLNFRAMSWVLEAGRC